MDNKNIVAIGGGTGLSILLSGLRKYSDNVTAIVTVADDGGSSGRLRKDLNMLPPGDIRSCLLALANTKESMEKLFSYRFDNGDLKGQSFGNLLIAAMNEIYGDFGIAVKETSEVLNITGQVLPVTLDKMDLVAELENGKKFLGESGIPKFSRKENSPIKKMFLENSEVKILDDCLEAIEKADLIILGPGSLYTSVIPNLLINNMVDAIMDANAKVIYICNVMTQAGETDGYGVVDHVEGILKHSREGMIDYCFVNTKEINEDVLKNYFIEDSIPVLLKFDDEEKLKKLDIELVTGDFIEIKQGYVRSDSIKISEKILSLI